MTTTLQLTIEDIVPTTETTLTAADLDEWIARLERSTWGTSNWPNEWARKGLAALLGEPIPYGRWPAEELLALLRRARAVA